MNEMVTLNRKEQKRLMVLNEVGVGRMTGMEAAQLLPLFYLGGSIKRGRSGS